MQENLNLFDIMVVGATPAGIMAALSAGRLGSKVLLSEYHKHIGGMSTSGLGKSDIEKRDAIDGIFKEFTQRVFKYYVDKYGKDSENVKLCKSGYYYEPSVAEYVFNQMIDENENVTLLLNHQIESVKTESNKISCISFKNRSNTEINTVKADKYIDATYEGDLFALSGAAYRVGREAKIEFDEEHAGRIFFDFDDMCFLEGSTGEADNKLTAYTYRLCLTEDPQNSYVMTNPPEGYERENYLKYLVDLREGRLGPPKVLREGHGYYPEHFNTLMRVFSFARIPNKKFDVNINPRPLGFPFVEENYTYLDSNWKEREEIFNKHRALALGLLYFVQNDHEVPEEHRSMARRYNLPLDEFTDNQHFPWQLYVREGRRLKGGYTLTENDVRLQKDNSRNTIFYDSIISGEFPIDSFPVSKDASKEKKVLEGYIGLLEISPYQIPYRILIPEKIENLIVPVAASTTHIAYSTIRMEPLWMGIGQAAGIAAHMACRTKINFKDVPINQLQEILLENRQIISYFVDITRNDKAFKAIQFWGTKGIFSSYNAEPMKPIENSDLNDFLQILHRLLNSDLSFNSPDNFDNVTIADFENLIKSLVLNYKLSSSTEKIADSLQKYKLDTTNWLYDQRELTTPVFRGEVCIAFYNLFFAIQKNSHSIKRG